MARETLTALMSLHPAEYSVMGIYLSNPAKAPELARRVREEIAKSLPVTDPIESKEDLTANIRKRWEGVRYFTIPLQVYISEVTDLLTAMEVSAYVLLVMIMLVVIASVVVTYRVVLYDRIKELGTMIALGFPRYWIVLMLLTEAAILVLAGVAGGMLISIGVTHMISYFSFQWIPGFELFMEEGRLRALYTARTVTANISIVLLAVMPVIAAMVVSLLRKQIPSLIKGELT
jgi:ABC-type antimicrobial peptide transport system permease subunit